VHVNVEIKARRQEPAQAKERALAAGAVAVGDDHQVDTYFRVPHGRLKLRQGRIENTLIRYHRADTPGARESLVTLHDTTGSDADSLRAALADALGVLVVVDKARWIGRAGIVKLHVDTVAGLGAFVEIEAMDLDGSIGTAALREQCEQWMGILDVRPDDIEPRSYSDLLLDAHGPP
jgi:adenylate cyclase class IV